MNQRKLRHPFNSEIDLETFKHMFNINGSITTSQNELVNVFKNFNPFEPLLSITKDLKFTDKIIFNHDLAFSLYDYNLTIDKNTKLITKAIDPKELDNYKEDIQKSINKLDSNKKSSFSYYFINYYYLDPKETLEDKLKYIESMQELELPKKYIYDLVNDKELYNDELKPQDKLILNLGLNQTEYFNLFLKSYIEEYYTQEVFKYIKELYRKLSKIEEYNPFTHSMVLNIHDELTLNDDLYLFDELVLNKESNNIIYTNSNIKSYHDLLEYNLKFFIQSLEKYNQDEKNFNNLLLKNKLTLDELKEYILIKYNSNNFDYLTLIHRTNIYTATQIIEATNRPLERILELIDTNVVFKEYQEDLYLYNELTTAKDDSKEHLYYLYLQLLILNENFIKDNINKIKIKLKNIDDSSTTEFNINEESKYLFTYHRRTEILKNELEAVKQKKTREMANNITTTLKFKQWSLGKLIGKSKKIYDDYKKQCEILDNQIEEIKAKLKNIDDESKEYDNLKKNKATLETKKEALIKDLLNKHNIIEIPYYDNLGKQHKQPMILYFVNQKYMQRGYKKEFIIETTPISLDFKRDDISISYPFNINYDTFINKKPITQTFSLKDLDSDRFGYLLSLILDEISNKPSKEIDIILDEKLFKKLDFTIENKKKAILFIRQHITLLSGIKFKEASITLVDKKGKKYNEKTAFTSIIQSGSIDNNILHLVVSDSFFNSIYYYDNKLNSWRLRTSSYYLNKDNGLSPIQNRMLDYSENLLNQNNFEISLINLYSQKRLQNIINNQGKPQAKKEALAMKNDLNIINNNNYNNITYNIPRGLELYTKIDLIKTVKIKAKHREETPKERHIRESIELKKNKE
jgi:hypothetical protein